MPAASTMLAAVPRAKLTGPCSPLTIIVLPSSYVVTVPVSYVVLVVGAVAVGLVDVVVFIVVVLVCANARGTPSLQTKTIIGFFPLISSISYLQSCHSEVDRAFQVYSVI